ncbi:MAG: hypothetical protein U0165_02845 [Polyangiaceae bacterium]
MCCFSRPVRHVAKTKIFARSVIDQRQILAYAMDSAIDEELAMVLPVPVPRASSEDAVRFIDLSGYPKMLVELDAAFPMMMAKSRSLFRMAPQSQSRSTLKVHDVGDFEASFSPSRSDLDRLDERFTLPAHVWTQLSMYDDWGFVVCKLKPSGSWFSRLLGRTSWKTLHPMAFEFPTREPSKLFFPTMHVHDGEVHKTAEFDHSLIWQRGGSAMLEHASYDSEINAAVLGSSVNVAKTMGVIDPGEGAFRLLVSGELENADTWV